MTVHTQYHRKFLALTTMAVPIYDRVRSIQAQTQITGV